MSEPTTVRILIQQDGVTLASARQGLVLIIGEDDDSAKKFPIRWEDALDILPSIRGKVQWLDSCKNCGDQITPLGGTLTHAWALEMNLATKACLIDPYQRWHNLPGPPSGDVVAVAERFTD